MHILGEVIDLEGTVAPAHGDYRHLALEQDEAFEHGRHLADGLPGDPSLGSIADHDLALAVIAEPSCLEDRRWLDTRECRIELIETVDRGVRRDLDSETTDEVLLGEPVLR